MSAGKQSVIVYAKRTPIGKMSGALSTVSAPKLAAPLVADAIKSTGLNPDDVDEIIMGNVLTAGIGQAPARQAGIYGGLPKSVCATTIGRVCGSGLKAIMLADQAIRLGDANLVFAGGMENMTQAPHLLMNARAGYRFGSVEAKDSMQHDGLWDPYGDMAMGNCGEVCAKEYKFSREDQDEYAVRSYARARASIADGHFAKEILPIEVASRRNTVVVEHDEEPASVDLEKLPNLRPAFDKEGSVTAGNASSINDGAALTVICSEDTAKAKGLQPVAKIIAQASFAHDPLWFTTAPVGSIKRVLDKAGLEVKDIDLWEINEAFAVVPMVAIKDLGIDRELVNVHGGAVSMGHPIGASGTRIVVTLINALKAAGKKRGLASICIGGGEASALIIELC
jgi:acetyl-CoA C-acetyltransferase